MQIDDLTFKGQLSNIASLYLQTMIVHERCLDLMGTSKVPKLEPLVDIKKPHVFIDSSGAPHLAKHISSWISLACRFFLTTMHHVTICHKKMF